MGGATGRGCALGVAGQEGGWGWGRGGQAVGAGPSPMRRVTEGSWAAWRSAVRFHTYWAPWGDRDDGPQPCAVPRAPARPLALRRPRRPEAPSPGAGPATPAPGRGRPASLRSGPRHPGTRGPGSPRGTCTGGLHPGSPAPAHEGRWAWGRPWVPPPGRWSGPGDCRLHTPGSPDTQPTAGLRLGCLGRGRCGARPSALARGPRRRTSMSTLETSCAAMSWQPSRRASAGIWASEYQFRFTVCA